MRILQVNTVDVGGGAAALSRRLLDGYRRHGHEARLVVGRKHGADADVVELADDDRAIYSITGYAALQRGLRRRAARAPGNGWGRIGRSLRLATHPQALTDVWSGREDFNFPGTARLFDLVGRPDIVHAHNLHGGFFDLTALGWISRGTPTLLTLHDEWLMTGHCAHAFDCDRWLDGCGACPDLTIEPAIRRDATAANWRRKQAIFRDSRLAVAAPCQWLLDRVQRSMLGPGLIDVRVVPNGVDLSVFHPADRQCVRSGLGLSSSDFVILVVTGAKGNRWRNAAMLEGVLTNLAERYQRFQRRIQIVAIGHDDLSGPRVRFDGFQDSATKTARYLQAADVLLHLAATDTFPTTILESLACGTPVIATAVGGIPEQIVSAWAGGSSPQIDTARDTGVLVLPCDVPSATAAVAALFQNDATLQALSRNAERDARVRFDFERQVECYLSWYGTIIERWTTDAVSEARKSVGAAARHDRDALAQSGGLHRDGASLRT